LNKAFETKNLLEETAITTFFYMCNHSSRMRRRRGFSTKKKYNVIAEFAEIFATGLWAQKSIKEERCNNHRNF
jgi:hypothetical protein